MKAEIEVLHPGLFSTIQDEGRWGYKKFGVPVSGCMDNYAFRMANLLLGNSMEAAVMEITQFGPKLKFYASAGIAICGGNLSPEINGIKISNNTVVKVKNDDVLGFGKRVSGCRCYLAIMDGFQNKEFLGSRSFYEGISEVAKLEKGMRLSFTVSEFNLHRKNAAIKFNSNYIENKELQVFPGPEFEKLDSEEQKFLESQTFLVDKNNSRMAIQLQQKLENSLEPILTGPVVPGTVQLTPGGNLIILMKDCQTTGGYPRILQLSETAMDTISQKVVGEEVKFSLKSFDFSD